MFISVMLKKLDMMVRLMTVRMVMLYKLVMAIRFMIATMVSLLSESQFRIITHELIQRVANMDS